MVRAVPGDPVDTLLGEHATELQRQDLRRQLGLDDSWWSQYGTLWASVWDGTLGESFGSGPPRHVSTVLMEHVPSTVELAVAGVLMAILIAIPLGLFAAFRAGTWADGAASAAALLGLAIPNFWLGPALIYLFAVQLRWLPDPVADAPALLALLLPAFVLGTALSGKLALMIRASVLDVLDEPYVLTARARGLPRWRIAWHYVLRNAAIPVVTVLGMQFASLLTGALITEKVFARPGLGTLLLDSVSERNYPVVQGVVLVMALSYVAINLLTDFAYAWLDPRVRLTGSRAGSTPLPASAGSSP